MVFEEFRPDIIPLVTNNNQMELAKDDITSPTTNRMPPINTVTLQPHLSVK